jgi:hypothetical protein
VTNTLTFTCTICGEPSTAICAYCTKDACGNHLCERCGRCSDCCECEIRLDAPVEATRNGAPTLAAEPAAAGAEIEPEQPITEEQREDAPDESSELVAAEPPTTAPPEPTPEFDAVDRRAVAPDAIETPEDREHQE